MACADENLDLLAYFTERPVDPVGDGRIGEAWLHFCSEFLNAANRALLAAHLGKPVGEVTVFDYRALPAKAKRMFADWLEETGECRCIVYDDPQAAPAWMMMEPSASGLLPAETPLLHFTDHAAAICAEGFTLGIPDVDRIALTFENSVYGGEPRRIRYGAPGYNFAYTADGSVDLGLRAGPYGSQAVVFLGEGLAVQHEGDREPQVVFWGPAADMTRAVAVTRKGDRWISDSGRSGKDLNRLVRRLVSDLRGGPSDTPEVNAEPVSLAPTF